MSTGQATVLASAARARKNASVVVFDALVLGYLVQNWLRLLIAVSAIALAVTVLLASLIIGGSVTRVQAALGREFTGEPALAIVPLDGDLDERLIATLWTLAGVHDVAPRVSGPATVGTSAVTLVGIDVLRPFAFAGSVRGDAPGAFDPRGRFIDRGPLVLGRNAIVSAPFARAHRLAAGSLLSLHIDGVEKRVRVAAIRPEPSTSYADDDVIVDVGVAQTLLHRAGRLTRIDCVIDPSQRAALMRALPSLIGRHARVIDAVDPRTVYLAAFAVLRDDARLVSLLVFLASMLIVYDAIAASVAARRAEIGTLRALGATRGTIFRCFIAEAAIVGGCGAVCGIALGIVVATALVGSALGGVVNADATVLLSVLFDDPRIIAGVFALTIAAMAVAALVPAIAAASVSPALAYGARGVALPLRERSNVMRGGVWIAAIAVLAALLAVAQRSLLAGAIEAPAIAAALFGVRALLHVVGRSGAETSTRIALRLGAANLGRPNPRTMLAATSVVFAVAVAAQTIVIRASTRSALGGTIGALHGIAVLELQLAVLTLAVALVATGSSFIAQAVERRDEFRLYRQLGLVMRALRAMVAFEGAVVGSASAIAGALIGVLFGTMIGHGATALPLASLAVLILCATTFSASAALVAANRIR